MIITIIISLKSVLMSDDIVGVIPSYQILFSFEYPK